MSQNVIESNLVKFHDSRCLHELKNTLCEK